MFGLKRYAAPLFFLISVLAHSQIRLDTTAAPSIATKDPAGLAVAARSVAAMSSPTLDITSVDSVATGNVVVQGQSMPIVLKTKGTRMLRSEVQKAKGSHVMVINNGRGQITQSDGTVRNLLMNGTYGVRILHLPALSLLAEYQQADVEVARPEQSAVSGKNSTVLTFAVVPPGRTKEESDLFRRDTSTRLFIDSDTGVVQKLEFNNPAENDPDSFQKTTVVYSDYRQVGQMMVPFRIATYVDGDLESEIVLDSIQFNVGLSDSDFQIKEEVKQ